MFHPLPDIISRLYRPLRYFWIPFPFVPLLARRPLLPCLRMSEQQVRDQKNRLPSCQPGCTSRVQEIRFCKWIF